MPSLLRDGKRYVRRNLLNMFKRSDHQWFVRTWFAATLRSRVQLVTSYAMTGLITYLVRHADRERLLLRTPGPVK